MKINNRERKSILLSSIFVYRFPCETEITKSMIGLINGKCLYVLIWIRFLWRNLGSVFREFLTNLRKNINNEDNGKCYQLNELYCLSFAEISSVFLWMHIICFISPFLRRIPLVLASEFGFLFIFSESFVIFYLQMTLWLDFYLSALILPVMAIIFWSK